MTPSTTKHVPGPWEPVRDISSKRVDIWAGDGEDWVGEAASMIDARVMAAAPDLLAVCEGLVAWWKADGISGNATLDALADAARAAVAKAKGTKP